MATLLDLKNKELFWLDPNLGASDQEIRSIYGSTRVRDWIRDVLPTAASQWNLDESPAQQLDSFMEIYALGEPLTFRHQFSPIRYRGEGIWELKTADIRMFGWFYEKDVFIASAIDEAWRVKEHNLYQGYAGEAVRFRTQIDLDGGKHVQGEDPNNVITNFTLP